MEEFSWKKKREKKRQEENKKKSEKALSQSGRNWFLFAGFRPFDNPMVRCTGRSTTFSAERGGATTLQST